MAQYVLISGRGSIYDPEDAVQFEFEPLWWDANEIQKRYPMTRNARSHYQDFWVDLTPSEAWSLHEFFKPRVQSWQLETALLTLERGLHLPHFLVFRVEVLEWDSGL